VDKLAPTVTDIINLSLKTGHFPDIMKMALVTPLLKKSSLNPDILSNYRPVSNLSFISKILEKVVDSQLSEFMSAHNLYEKHQSAYRPGHSTETALLRVQNDILHALDMQQGTILVLLDSSTAFDTVDHAILLERLHNNIGVSGVALKWFHSYLTERHQSVCVQGDSSTPVELAYGVPQGSVLGPKMFTIYSSPVGQLTRKNNVNDHMYADDTQLYKFFNLKDITTTGQALEIVENCVDTIRSWMLQNKLKLNDSKTEFLLLASPRLHNNINISSIRIGTTDVTPSATARNLGVQFDKFMDMQAHVKNICRACYFEIHDIGKVRSLLNKEAAEQLVHAFITSRLDNGNSLLYGLPDILIKRLQKVQNTAARIVTGTKKLDHITPVLKSLHWLPVKYRIDFKILLLTYKAIHGLAPDYLSELLVPYTPVRNLRSGSKKQLTAPSTNLKTYGDRSFSMEPPTLWNKLPASIKNSATLLSFKSSLKQHLFKKAFQ
jgi:hypothetical protein